MRRTKKQQPKPTTIPMTEPKSQTNPKLKNKAKTQTVLFCAIVFLSCGIFRCGVFGFHVFCGISYNSLI